MENRFNDNSEPMSRIVVLVTAMRWTNNFIEPNLKATSDRRDSTVPSSGLKVRGFRFPNSEGLVELEEFSGDKGQPGTLNHKTVVLRSRSTQCFTGRLANYHARSWGAAETGPSRFRV